MNTRQKLILTFSSLILILLLAACGEATSTVALVVATNPTNTNAPAITINPATAATTTNPTTAAPTTTAAITSATATTVNPTVAITQPASVNQPTAEAVVRQFVEAANRNDTQAVANSFAPDARFDSVGRIYQGRNQIMERFLIPEVLNVGGRYEILSVRQEGEAITFEFNFRAGSATEQFTYRCVVRGGQIQDVVGRYVAAQTTTVATTANKIDPAVECYVNAMNSKNLNSLANCFAPDGAVMDVSRKISGQAAIRTWAQNEVIGGRLEVLENQASPNRNRVLVHWSPAGSNGWRAYYTFDFKDGKITLADLQYA